MVNLFPDRCCYAQAHWQAAQKASIYSKWGHRLVACLEEVPILGNIVALIELAVRKIFNLKNSQDPKKTPTSPSTQLTNPTFAHSANSKPAKSVFPPAKKTDLLATKPSAASAKSSESSTPLPPPTPVFTKVNKADVEKHLSSTGVITENKGSSVSVSKTVEFDDED